MIRSQSYPKHAIPCLPSLLQRGESWVLSSASSRPRSSCLQETHQPSSSQLDVVTTHDMDMDIEDSASIDDFSNTAMVPRERRYDDEGLDCGTHS